MRRPEFPVRGSDTAHAFAWGVIAALSLIAGIFTGSRGLKDFDPALVSYAGATVFAAFGDDDLVKVKSHRGEIVVRAQLVKTIPPDTVFVPYHWPLGRSANNCTIRAIDPVSSIPEFKVCAVRGSKTEAPTDANSQLGMEAGGIR